MHLFLPSPKPHFTNHGNRTPTLTAYCPEATASQICGLANGGIIDSTALNENFNEDGSASSPEECYQYCLSLEDCKSYFTSEQPDESGLYNCLIFRNTLKGNVASASAGTQFYDRGCPENVPVCYVFPLPILS